MENRTGPVKPDTNKKKQGEKADTTSVSWSFRGGISWPREREGVLVGRAAKAVESHKPGGHGVPLTVHNAFLPSSKKKKKL